MEFDVEGGGARLTVVKMARPSDVASGPAILGYAGPRIPIDQLEGASRPGGGPDVRAVDTNVLARYYLADDPSQALDCLRHLAEIPGVTIEEAEEVHAAFELCASGLEFADVLHLCASSACTELLTFDDRFVRRASRVKGKPV